jgi:hypothetical protein
MRCVVEKLTASPSSTPRLEPGKHDAFIWLDAKQLELMMVKRSDGDDRLQRIIAEALTPHAAVMAPTDRESTQRR